MRYKKYPSRRKSSGKRAARKRSVSMRKILFISLPILFTAAVSLTIYGYLVLKGLPSVNQLDHPRADFATKIYSADGLQIGQFSVINRSQISLDEIPPYLIKALISSEDRKFYRHKGIDPDRILKAAVKNILSFRIREGASTITQQVARNLYLNQEQSYTRKIREAITAVQIERRYSKEKILEYYFNLAFFGNGSYGIDAASNRYFGKRPAELTLPESAFLIGILPNPVIFDPYKHPDRAKTRRDIVLQSMLKMEYISSEVFKAAITRPLTIKEHPVSADSQIAPHFIEFIRRELADLSVLYGFDIYRDGLVIHTTLDSRMQRHANNAVSTHINEQQKIFDGRWNWDSPRSRETLQRRIETEIRRSANYRDAEDDKVREAIRVRLLSDEDFIYRIRQRLKMIQAGFVALDPATGEIKAMVGSSDYTDNPAGLNHVTQIRRQPGSAFKPIVYTVAIDNGYMPSYELPNEPVAIRTREGDIWSPANHDGRTGGKATLREGLVSSINIIAVRTLLDLAPVNQVIECARRLGITSSIPPFESVSLGTAEVTPLELTAAYGVFAAGGHYAKPRGIRRIESGDGELILDFPENVKMVLKPETAYIITDMLEDVIDYGTGTSARFYIDFPAAGKTGTTQGYADGWFVGYTPDLVAGVWTGFDDRRITFGSPGGHGAQTALPIWGKFMRDAYADINLDLEKREFPVPAGIKRVNLCAESKMLANRHCNETIEEVTLAGRELKECDLHRSFLRSVKNFISNIFR